VGVEKLHRNYNIRATPDKRQRAHEAIRARKGVVKMLIASVIIYFLSYSPHQVRYTPLKSLSVYVICRLKIFEKATLVYLYCGGDGGNKHDSWTSVNADVGEASGCPSSASVSML
jgi:hypothetical protein